MVYSLFYRVIPLSVVLPMIFLEIGVALPPPEDIPEEVLRTEIITEGRSPMNGEPLTAAEYAQIREKLGERPYPPEIDSKLQNLIFLLKIRKMLKTFVPLPIIP
ncbi:hypothetical protein [Crocosphaera chwakensis]|uniref:Glutathione S-transferase n=1 Tax=Crocosphaera chwakensis CCY0110 TaxID=391612 RepID=A3IWP6_9CHRO|nr:hypothetical protein [Crocosphaera chwakensis]EAZ89101.1 hypothetical protein CY0110_00745 [Crocosphaera chwakensis CCY0110]